MIRLFAVLLLISVHAAPHAQGVDGTLKKIQDSKSISIAYRTDALPFSYAGKGNEPAGYTVDLCKRIVASLERQLKVQPLQIKWVPATTQNRFELVRKGQADMECGSTTVTLARMAEVDFSSYVFIDSTGVLVRTAAAAQVFKDLAGKRIAVVANTTNNAAVEMQLKRLGMAATVVRVKTREEGMAALEAGTVDAYASDKLLLVGLGAKVKNPSQYTLLPDDLSFEPYTIMLPRGDANFRLAVNRALAEIYRSNDIMEIFQRAFGVNAEPTGMLVIIYGLGAYPN